MYLCYMCVCVSAYSVFLCLCVCVMFLCLGCVCMCTSVCVVYMCVQEAGQEEKEGGTERERERAFNQTAAFTELKWCCPTGPVQQAALKGQSWRDRRRRGEHFQDVLRHSLGWPGRKQTPGFSGVQNRAVQPFIMCSRPGWVSP